MRARARQVGRERARKEICMYVVCCVQGGRASRELFLLSRGFMEFHSRNKRERDFGPHNLRAAHIIVRNVRRQRSIGTITMWLAEVCLTHFFKL